LAVQDGELKANRTETRSFRFPTRILDSIDEEAARLKISTNTLVSRLLTTYIEYDRHLNKFRLIKISSHTLGRLLLAPTETEVAESGKRAGETMPKAYSLEKYGAFTLENLLKYILEFSASSGLYESSVVVLNGKTNITLTHSFSRNGSLFFASYYERAFELLNISTKMDLTDYSVSIQF
jgi:hypothetical protein